MSGKIDWVALNPVRSPGAEADRPRDLGFKRDVTPLGRDAERNHVKLSQLAQQVGVLRRGEA